jgi:serpin B
MNATRAMAIDLYRQVRGSQPGNLLISPYSIWMAVAMLHPGARGKSRDALSRVLGIDDVAAVAALGRELAKRREPAEWQKNMIERGYAQATSYGFHLDVANKLWVQTGYRIKPEYGQQLADAFGVDPAPVDFANAPGAACDAINRWVNDQTRGKIRDIVSPMVITPLLRAILANAIYFKAGWADEFNESVTRPEPFKLLDGSKVTVPLMRKMASYRHAEVDGATVIELRYIQPDVAMVVIAPKAGTFADVEKKLTTAWYDKAIGALGDAYPTIDLRLPKFRFETGMSIAKSLAEIGLADVMVGNADLSGVSDEPGFGVGDVFHKTFIAVDEKGTEAAAVTAMGVAGCGRPPKPIEVIVDRPFFVAIRDIPTGTELFFGRVVDPR